jgi:GAF domain-containing protein
VKTVDRKIWRVVIVDDSRTSQAILETAFEARLDFKVVGVASDAETGRDMIRRLAPDLVTIDLCMPYIDGTSMLEMIASMTAVCKVIVSDQATENVFLSSKLEALGASLCIGKRDVIADPSGFFRKVSKACDRIAAASVGRGAGPVLSSDPSRRAGARRPSEAVHFGYPVPHDEHARLQLIQRKQLANAVRERQFDQITQYTASATDFPVCLLTFIDRDTQWIKSSYGFEGQSTRRADAFCSHTIASESLFIVANAATDARFSGNPLVVGRPGFRTYVGHPVVSDEGVRVGALCVLDTKVRTVSAPVRRQLAAIANVVGGMIDSRPAVAA